MRDVTNQLIAGAFLGVKEFKGLFTGKSSGMLLFAVSQHEDVLVEKYTKYEKARIGLCEKWADKDNEGKPVIIKIDENTSRYQFTTENEKSFNDEWDELKQTTVEVPSFKVTLEQIKDLQIEPGMWPNSTSFFKYFVNIE